MAAVAFAGQTSHLDITFELKKGKVRKEWLDEIGVIVKASWCKQKQMDQLIDASCAGRLGRFLSCFNRTCLYGILEMSHADLMHQHPTITSTMY